MDGCVPQCFRGVGDTHLIIPDVLSGYADTHLTEILNGSHAGLTAKNSLEMGTSNGEFVAYFFNFQMLRNVFHIIFCDTIKN